MLSSKKALQWRRSEPADPTRPCHLLDLPTELRTLIFEHIVVVRFPMRNMRKRLENGCYVRPWEDEEMIPAFEDNPSRIHINIMQTCRQMHVEAAHLLYSRNIFYLEDVEPLEVHLPGSTEVTHTQAVHHAYNSLIRRVRLCVHNADYTYNRANAIIYMLKRWLNVREVQIQLEPEAFEVYEQSLNKLTTESEARAYMESIIEEIVCIFSMADFAIPQHLEVQFGIAEEISEAYRPNAAEDVVALNAIFNQALIEARKRRRRTRI